MTPKEKARELAYSFYNGIVKNTVTAIGKDDAAKQCALIAVDEILSVLDLLNKPERTMFIEWEQFKEKDAADVMDGNDMKDYWLEVKTEIEKL